MNSSDLASLRSVLHAEKRPAAFIGSGLSTDSYPGWQQFLTALQKMANEKSIQRKKLTMHEQLHYAQRSKDKLIGYERFHQFMEKTFTGGEIPSVFRTLVTLPFAFFITTNYDCNIEDAYKKVRGKSLEVVYPHTYKRALELLSKNEPFVFKIHGCAKKATKDDDTVVGLSDYLAMLSNNNPVLQVLQVLLAAHPLLIAGYGMSDPHIQTIFAIIARLSSSGPERFYFTRNKNEEVFKAQGLTPIYIADHSKIEELLQELSFSQMHDNQLQIRRQLITEFNSFIGEIDHNAVWGALFYARASSEIGIQEACAQLRKAVQKNVNAKNLIESRPTLHTSYLIIQGQALKRGGKSELAKKTFQQLEKLVLTNRTLTAPLRALAFRYAGIFWMWPPKGILKDWQRARDLFLKSLTYCKNLPHEQLDVRKYLATLDGQESKYPEAINKLKKIRKDANKLGYKRNEAWTLVSIVEVWLLKYSEVQSRKSKLEELLGLINDAIPIFQGIGHNQGLGESYLRKAQLHRMMGDNVDICKKHAESALAYSTIAGVSRTCKLAKDILDSLNQIEIEVTLVNFSKDWKVAFDRTKACLSAIMGDYLKDVQHIGSTSVSGIKAKPIIDIAAGVANLDVAKKLIPILQGYGYEHVPEFSKKNDKVVYFIKGPIAMRSEHLYLMQHDGETWKRYLFFRDRLLEDDKLRKKYERLKITLAKKYSSNRTKYTAMKAKFVEGVLDGER